MNYTARAKFIGRIARKRVRDLETRIAELHRLQEAMIILLVVVLLGGGIGFIFNSGSGIAPLFIIIGAGLVFWVFVKAATTVERHTDRKRLYARLLDYAIWTIQRNDDCPFAWDRIKKTYNFLEDRPLDKDIA
jgi:uncharacterized RDD family membrane protein YckC